MSSDGRFVLAVDCGSTNLKAAVFNAALERLGQASAPVRYSLRDGTRFEMPVPPMIEAFLSVCSEACAAAGIREECLDAVSFASQAQTFAVLDRQGSPQTPFLSWMDKRAVEEADELRGILGDGFHRHCSFSSVIPQLELAKVLWVRRHFPELNLADSQIVTLPAFLGMALGSENVVDRNLAAMGGLYSLRDGDWWGEAMRACGVSRRSLGCLVDVGSEVGARRAAPPKKFSEKLRIVLAGNDQTAGAYGNGCASGGMVIALGTALVVYRHAGQARGPFHSGGCWGPYPGGGFYELATRDEGCLALDWAGGQIFGAYEPGEFDRLASPLWKNGPAPEVPFFFPGRIHSDSAWTGGGDAGQRAYAVLEGIAFSLKELVEEGIQAHRKPQVIIVLGGGSQSALWLDIIANVLDCPLVRGSGDALRGAGAMALKRVVDRAVGASPTYEPNPDRQASLKKRYEIWQAKR